MTYEMLTKAQLNADKLGMRNVEFRYGDIEKLPLLDNFVDVVISNCVINLATDKKKVYSEILRVLKPGGHFSISDILVSDPLPEKIRKAAALHVGCVSGAFVKKE